MSEYDLKYLEMTRLAEQSLRGELTEERSLRLDELLVNDPVFRQLYIEYLDLHANLKGLGRTQGELDTSFERAVRLTVVPPSRSERRLFLQHTALLVACVFLGSAAVWAHLYYQPVARLASTVDFDGFEESSPQLMSDNRLRRGLYRFSNGLASLILNDGTRLVFRGPSEFQLHPGSRVDLKQGEVSIEVADSSAHFEVRTPEGQVIDHGTRFTVRVDGENKSRVDVADGSVSLTPPNGDLSAGLLLKQFEAGELQRERPVPRRVAINRFCYVSSETVAALVKTEGDPSFRHWLGYSYGIRKDPSLLLYYPFTQNEKSHLLRASSGNYPHRMHIEGALPVTGRWPQKGGVELLGTTSETRLALPSAGLPDFKSGSFSVVIWFRTTHFRFDHQPLVTQGDQSWRLQGDNEGDEGRLTFIVHQSAVQTDGLGKARSKHAVDDGRWHCAVAVYHANDTQPRCSLYLDGLLQETVPCDPVRPTQDPIWIGGNSDVPDRGFAGQIDEFALFSRDLSADEIVHLYQAGLSPQSF